MMNKKTRKAKIVVFVAGFVFTIAVLIQTVP